jgi:hypothetical protein
MPILTRATHVLTKRMPKIISPKAHAVVDYVTAGAFLLTGAFYWSRNKRAALGAFVCGGAELATSLLTDYPGGVKKVISFRNHGRIDLGLAAMTATMPEFMGFRHDREKSFFLAQAALITAVTDLTDFGQISRARSPRRKKTKAA